MWSSLDILKNNNFRAVKVNATTQIPLNGIAVFWRTINAHMLWLSAHSVVSEIRKWCSSHVVDGRRNKPPREEMDKEKGLLNGKLSFRPCQRVTSTGIMLFALVSNATCWPNTQLKHRAHGLVNLYKCKVKLQCVSIIKECYIKLNMPIFQHIFEDLYLLRLFWTIFLTVFLIVLDCCYNNKHAFA